MFAPWIIYKKDFQAIGGHDPLFAPFPYEDSDIFQRWILAGYELVQSRDAFVYHLTCRGHRWNEQVGKDDEYYKTVSQRASRNYIRKWGSWIKNNEYQHPIIPHKYNIGFKVHNCNQSFLELLEVWCDVIWVSENIIEEYIQKEQANTKYDLRKRVHSIEGSDVKDYMDITVEFDAKNFTQNSFNIIQSLSDIITESGEIGEFTLDCFKITIQQLETYEKNLIRLV